ncbi:MAG TPA: potassium transporter, partial [Chitinophagaceae bacterium]|nr:potassium transporter [Chitinophagaceae bacterium]
AQRAARTFFKMDEANLKKLASIRDPDEYLVEVKAKIEELEQTLQADMSQQGSLVDEGWNEESLIAAVKSGESVAAE